MNIFKKIFNKWLLSNQNCIIKIYFLNFSGHQEILRAEGKCTKYDPVPLVLVKDIMNYMPQMKYMFANVASSNSDPAAKRQRLSWPELVSADLYTGYLL